MANKQISVLIDEENLVKVKIIALQRGTTLSLMVREFIETTIEINEKYNKEPLKSRNLKIPTAEMP